MKFMCYGNKYRSYVVEGSVSFDVICSIGMDACFMEIVDVATPEDAMRAWSVSEDNALTLIKPGVWRARYDLVTVAMRDYAMVQQRPRQSAIKKATHVQQQRLLEGE